MYAITTYFVRVKQIQAESVSRQIEVELHHGFRASPRIPSLVNHSITIMSCPSVANSTFRRSLSDTVLAAAPVMY